MKPPFSINNQILTLVADISECLVKLFLSLTPQISSHVNLLFIHLLGNGLERESQ